MKFVTLALALLLAVGSQAVPLQADAPQVLANVRSAATVYLENLKQSLRNVVNQLEDGEMKTKANEHVDNAFNKIDKFREGFAPMTDTVVGTVMDITSDFRRSIEADIDELKKTLETKGAELKKVVNSHMDGYKEKFGPIMTEYHANHQAEMEALRKKLEPILEEMQGTIGGNVEETKGALMPIVDAISEKINKWLGEVKVMVKPYYDEYKEVVTKGFQSVQSPERAAALREDLLPLAQQLVATLQAMAEKIGAAVTQQ